MCHCDHRIFEFESFFNTDKLVDKTLKQNAPQTTFWMKKMRRRQDFFVKRMRKTCVRKVVGKIFVTEKIVRLNPDEYFILLM